MTSSGCTTEPATTAHTQVRWRLQELGIEPPAPTSPVASYVPAVLNGASDLLLSIFGEKGQHARSGPANTKLK